MGVQGSRCLHTDRCPNRRTDTVWLFAAIIVVWAEQLTQLLLLLTLCETDQQTPISMNPL